MSAVGTALIEVMSTASRDQTTQAGPDIEPDTNDDNPPRPPPLQLRTECRS